MLCVCSYHEEKGVRVAVCCGFTVLQLVAPSSPSHSCIVLLEHNFFHSQKAQSVVPFLKTCDVGETVSLLYRIIKVSHEILIIAARSFKTVFIKKNILNFGAL